MSAPASFELRLCSCYVRCSTRTAASPAVPEAARGGTLGRICCFFGRKSRPAAQVRRSAAGTGLGRGRAPGRRRGGSAGLVRRSAGRPFWQELMRFWQNLSAPPDRRRRSRLGRGAAGGRRLSSFVLATAREFRARAGQSPDYSACCGKSDDNDKYSSKPAMLYLPRCVRHGLDAIWY